jgi:S1-C subfamily serine protease
MKEGTQGLAVIGVDPVGPAADAGVREGDVIEAANGQSVRSAADLNGVLDKAGERPVLLLINRQGQSAYLAIRPRRN